MKHPELFKKLCFQLPVLFSLNILAIQLYFITENIASRLNVYFVGLLLEFLKIVEVFSINYHQFS